MLQPGNATKEGSTRCDIKIQQASTSPSCSKTVNPTKHHACQIGTENINGKIEMLGKDHQKH
jgi:hypothetical protein